jgi:hypothetical protein
MTLSLEEVNDMAVSDRKDCIKIHNKVTKELNEKLKSGKK